MVRTGRERLISSLALFDIENHLSQKWKKQDYYQNFIYAGRENLTVDFEYTFRFGKDLIQYDYSKNAAGLLVSEKLNVNEWAHLRCTVPYFLSGHLSRRISRPMRITFL